MEARSMPEMRKMGMEVGSGGGGAWEEVWRIGVVELSFNIDNVLG
jgi:hypothetical protein